MDLVEIGWLCAPVQRLQCYVEPNSSITACGEELARCFTGVQENNITRKNKEVGSSLL